MTLTLYNTLTRRKETFTPLEPGKVKMYCCGVTVYDYCHLGHARSYIVWDMVRRYLLWRGYQVRYVQNFTDIDDKILNKARQENSSMEAVAEKYIQTYFEDMDRLNIMKADEYPRATHTLDGIKRLIHELEHKGFAYPAAGDVYYTVGNFSEYGKLSGRNLADMQAGASGRVEVEDPEAAKKKHPFDFALWKAAKPGEPAWESPWGSGRPGWHIECSAMVRQCLGESIDIHVGGADLVFPHHENEIAQSEAVTGKSLASYWLHNGMVNVDGEKMSKSLGNFTTIRQLLDGPDRPNPMAVRLFVLQANYRKPIDFTAEAINSAKNSWNTILEGLLFAKDWGEYLDWKNIDIDPNEPSHRENLDTDIVERFESAMDDDFNSPAALAVLFEIAKELRRARNLLVHQGKIDTDSKILEHQWCTFVCLIKVLGFSFDPLRKMPLSAGNIKADSSTVSLEVDVIPNLSEQQIEDLIQQREAARKAKNFAEGDRIRDQLKAAGITLIDTAEGTRWHRN